MISLRNVRVNNLKNVDLDIPHGQIVAFCGLSGSGKSSLAFDTLYAEGQRRYLENLSPHTRQYVNQIDKPDADRIDGIPPAIAVRAFRGKVGKKTTVGSATEIFEYLKVMFAHAATVVCPDCHIGVTRNDPQSVAQWANGIDLGMRIQIVFETDENENWAESLLAAKRNGFVRAIVGTQTVDLSSPDSGQIDPGGGSIGPIRIVVDRLKIGSGDLARLRESIEIAFQFGRGECAILLESSDLMERGVVVDGKNWERTSFSQELSCASCRRVFLAAEPRLFSVSNKFGACPQCDGIGRVGKEGAQACELCDGQRLNRDALSYRLGGKNFFEIGLLDIGEAVDFFQTLELSTFDSNVTRWVIPEIVSRLNYLCEVGLSYLVLGRHLRTLSTGEAQRIALTSCLSSALVNLLYVLDEPTIGLHAHDVENLVEAIGKLHQRGNTVVVVDHNERLIRSADRLIEIGPEAGTSGGEIVFDGTVAEIIKAENSITGDFLAGRRGVSWGVENRKTGRGVVKLTGARGHNLKNIDVEFPLGCLCLVTGVSGAGKSSLVQQTLYGAICERKEKTCDAPLPYDAVFGDGQFDEVVLVDQSPIGRSPRSNPVTYVKAFDDIRRTYSETLDARTHNLSMGQFSFNVAGGALR